MDLKHLKKIENVAFFNFAATNAVAGAMGLVKDNEGIKGKIKHQFGVLWNHVRQLMNTVDNEAKHFHVEKMKKLPSEKWKEYVELTEGYDVFSDHLTTFAVQHI